MGITHTLAAALAVAALVAPSVQAQPADMHASTAIAAARAQEKRDMRLPGARTAELPPRDAGKAVPAPLPGPPTWPVNPQVIEPTASAETTDGQGIDWAPIAIGGAASLLLVAGLAVLGTRRTRRLHRPRVTA